MSLSKWNGGAEQNWEETTRRRLLEMASTNRTRGDGRRMHEKAYKLPTWAHEERVGLGGGGVNRCRQMKSPCSPPRNGRDKWRRFPTTTLA